MNLLLIDSDENDAFAALYSDGALHVVKSSEFTFGSTKTPRSPDKLIHCLRKLRTEYDFRMADAIAVTIGPGSFTGIRVGLALAKGIAGASDKQLIPVTNFDLLYERIEGKEPGKRYCLLIPAKYPEYYYSIMSGAKQEEAGCLHIEEILAKNGNNVVFVGNFDNDSILKHSYFIYSDVTKSALSGPDAMLRLAVRYISEGTARPAKDVEPLYMKDFSFRKNV